MFISLFAFALALSVGSNTALMTQESNNNAGYRSFVNSDYISSEDILTNDYYLNFSLSYDNIVYDHFLQISGDTGPSIGNRIYVDFQDNLPSINYTISIELQLKWANQSLHMHDLCYEVPLWRDNSENGGYHYYYNISGMTFDTDCKFRVYFNFINQDIYDSLVDSTADQYTVGYNVGYDEGFDDGYVEGKADGYPDAYEDGSIHGYSVGYDNGYLQGVADGREQVIDEGQTASVIFNGIISIGVLPVNVFLKILNFEVFGINIGAFVSSLLTIMVIITIIRTFMGGKSGD